MTAAPSLFACITTRDGAIRSDVMGCLVAAINHAQAAGVKVHAGRQQFGHGTAVCRNKAVADFLAHTDCTHLLFIDDDVILPEGSLVQLAEALARPGVDIAAGAYPTFRFVGTRHAYLYLTARPVGGDWLAEWPDGLVEVDAAGTGCMAIARPVFAAVGFPWFRWPEQHDPTTGTVQWVSDDVDFCRAARDKGFRVWCDGRVRPGHLKLADLKTLMDGTLRWREAPPPADEGYGSHAGALRAIARALPVKTVVEYGSGRYSTPLFLDRGAFPDLERLLSVESDRSWIEDTRRACGADPRLELRWCPIGAVHEYGADPADLVLIDCDTVEGDRHDYGPRLKLLAKYATDPRAVVVVVHDSNFASIHPAVQAAPFAFKAVYVPPFGPHTAILSNAVDVAKVLGGKS